MPPRRRAAAGGSRAATTGGGATLLSLPDSLLIEILRHVDEEERFEHVALVCKRLLGLTRSPELLADCCIGIIGSDTDVLPRLRAAVTFLCTHGQHIRRLELCAEPTAGAAYPPRSAKELEALVASCLAAISAAGGRLGTLVVGEQTPVVCTAWLPALTALAELDMGNRQYQLQLPNGISRLSCLRLAHLRGSMLHLPADGLPPSLTELGLQGSSTAELSGAQASLSRLTNLVKLQLQDTAGGPVDLGGLRSLSTLTYLGLFSTPLPGCLPALSQLAALAVGSCQAGESAALDAALQQLTQLRRLAISCPELDSMPPSLTALSGLERLCFDGDAEVILRLPRGAWLSSLRWLGMDWVDVQEALTDGTLAQMAQLQYLGLLNTPISKAAVGARSWDALWAFFATHPPLCCLGMDMLPGSETTVDLALLDEVLDLKHRRPALQLRRTGRHACGDFYTELVHEDGIPAGSGV